MMDFVHVELSGLLARADYLNIVNIRKIGSSEQYFLFITAAFPGEAFMASFVLSHGWERNHACG